MVTATISEWLNGETAGGVLLPIETVNKRRAHHNLPPLERTESAIGSQVNNKIRSRGLGDTLAAITHATGIDRVVKAVTGGRDCGCGKRQAALNRMFPYAKKTAPVAVIVTTHNYARYLGECLDSIEASTVAPAEVIVIDDASDDDPASVCRSRGVRCERVEFRSVYKTRGHGLGLTQSPFVIFLDADDRLPPNYIEAGLEQFTRDTIGIVNSNLQHFGDSEQLRRLGPCDIDRENYIHAGAIVRRVALEQSRAYDEKMPVGNTRADWFVWRCVLAQGWQVAHNPAAYEYRQHGAAMHHADGQLTYRQLREIDRETVQVVIPFSGRGQFFDRLTEWVDLQTWPRIEVMAVDTSDDPAFRLQVRAWLASLNCASQYVPLPPTNRLADRDRRRDNAAYRAVQQQMGVIYGAVRSRLTQPFAIIVEDDVLPPLNAIDHLADGFTSPNVAAVSGAVPSRWERDTWVAWRDGLALLKSRGSGIESVGGTGFGCLLIRRAALQSVPVHHSGVTGNYDQSISRDLGPGWEWKLHWGVECQHG